MPTRKRRLGGRKRPWSPAWDSRESGAEWLREKPGGRESEAGRPRVQSRVAEGASKELEVAVGAEPAVDFIERERGLEAEGASPGGSKAAGRVAWMLGGQGCFVGRRPRERGWREVADAVEGAPVLDRSTCGGYRCADLMSGSNRQFECQTLDTGLELGSRGRWPTMEAGLDADGLLARRPREAERKRSVWRSGSRLGRCRHGFGRFRQGETEEELGDGSGDAGDGDGCLTGRRRGAACRGWRW